MTLTDWMAIVGAITGVVGTVLGIISAIDLFQKNRVRLRVVPKLAWTNTSGVALTTHLDPAESIALRGIPDRFAVEIVNLSAFPVTISQVGLGNPGSGRSVFVVPEVSPGFTWPPVLESRRAVTVYQRLDRFSFGVTSIPRNVYVETECGAVKLARSAALDWLVSRFDEHKKVGAGS